MKEEGREYWFRIVILFALGFVGILSSFPIIPKLLLISSQEAPFSMPVLYVISAIQSSVFVLAMIFLGSWASPKVNLGTPYIDSYINNSLGKIKYRNTLLSAVFGGVAGGVSIIVFSKLFLPYLPTEFVENSMNFSPPVYTKLLYGGIAEEILIRFGLMSFFTWGLYRLTQKPESSIRPHNYILAILFSSLLFGALHLPVVSLLSPVITSTLVLYIVLANTIFGLIAGYLYWKRGLEAAIISHMLAHIVMILGEKIA